MANAEMDNWERELKRKPAAVPTAAVGSPNGKLANKRRMRATHGYRTRAARGEEQEEEDFEVIFIEGKNLILIKNEDCH